MNIAGEHRLPAAPAVVWRVLHDTDVLREALPGCRELEQTGPQIYTGAAMVGAAVIKGLYHGTLQLLEEDEPRSARVRIDARSGHAEIKGEGSLSLEPAEDGTLVRYSGEARISGPLAVVGQRLLPAAAKSITEQFFRNVAERLQLETMKNPSGR